MSKFWFWCLSYYVAAAAARSTVVDATASAVLVVGNATRGRSPMTGTGAGWLTDCSVGCVVCIRCSILLHTLFVRWRRLWDIMRSRALRIFVSWKQFVFNIERGRMCFIFLPIVDSTLAAFSRVHNLFTTVRSREYDKTELQSISWRHPAKFEPKTFNYIIYVKIENKLARLNSAKNCTSHNKTDNKFRQENHTFN